MLSEQERAELRATVTQATADRNGRAALGAMRQLVAATAKPAADLSFCASALSRMAESLVQEGVLRPLRTFFVRSVTLEPLLPALKVQAALEGFLLHVQLGDYGSYLDDPMNEAGPLATFGPDLVCIVLELEDVAGDLAQLIAAGDGKAAFERIDAATAMVGQMLRGLRRVSRARVVLQGFVLPAFTAAGDVGDANFAWSLPRSVAELNARLAALCRELPDCIFFDADRTAARVGRALWRDGRLFLSARLAVSAAAQPAYVEGLLRSAFALFRAPRKVLCTDLDNTLWGGVLGEEGPGGIATGTAFPGVCYLEYQRYLKQLAARGVLLVAVSKNNPADVEEAFHLRAADLALTLDDFVARKIGWGDKAQTLRELAAELSLGLDSFVFVDDHPVECAAMRQQLPEVATLELPGEEPWRFVDLLASKPYFDAATVSADDTRRTEEYRAQARRAELADSAASREDFLASLGIVCTFLPVHEAPLARAVQLLGKTNQFNLTTRRYGAAEVEGFSREGEAMAVRVRDRFGDAGVVGLALVSRQDSGRSWCIDSFLLSCRVIGRGIETAILAELARRATADGASRLLGIYVPTAKNNLCAQVYPEHGFTEVAGAGQDGTVTFSLDLPAAAPEVPAWIEVERTAAPTLKEFQT